MASDRGSDIRPKVAVSTVMFASSPQLDAERWSVKVVVTAGPSQFLECLGSQGHSGTRHKRGE